MLHKYTFNAVLDASPHITREDLLSLPPSAVPWSNGEAFAVDVDSPEWKALLPNKTPLAGQIPSPPRVPMPGDVVAIVLTRMGYTSGAGCGCAAFKKKMNEWGWAGCTLHILEIVEWFAAKAREAHIEITVKTLAIFFKEAWVEVNNARLAQK